MYQANRETLQLKTIKDILNGHNEYVLQLHMTNTMKEHYHSIIIPQLMQVGSWSLRTFERFKPKIFCALLLNKYFTKTAIACYEKKWERVSNSVAPTFCTIPGK